MRRFQLAASLLGGLFLLPGCGTGFASGLPWSPDFGEMGPPAYREMPSSAAPDFTMLPPPTDLPTKPLPAPTQPAPTQPTPPPVSDSEYLSQLEEDILRMVNEERAKAGAQAMVMESLRRNVARAHSKDMAVRSFFDHNNPDGKSPFDRMKAAGISYSTAGENIAYNSLPVDRSAKAAMDSWMKSDGHRKNILNTKYGRTGIGVYRNPSNGRIYLTQVFTN